MLHHTVSNLGVMVSVLDSCVVDRGLKLWSGQTKDYKISICCFSAEHATLRRKSKDWLALNQTNVSELGDMSISGLLFQWVSTIKIQLSMLVKCKADLVIISLKINLFLPWYSWKIAELVLNYILLTLTVSNVCYLLGSIKYILVWKYMVTRLSYFIFHVATSFSNLYHLLVCSLCLM
jgi:hypothetical protein